MPAVEAQALVEMAARNLVLEHQHAPVQEQQVAECRPVGAEGQPEQAEPEQVLGPSQAVGWLGPQ